MRLLTNLETNTQKLLQIILIGQPELRELLARNELRQLAQRITGRYHLNPLSRDETIAYVRHRLRVAGATTDIFSPGALREVFRLSQGVPRVINVICDRALLGAYSLDRHRVTGALVRNAAAEVFGRRFAPHWLPWAATRPSPRRSCSRTRGAVALRALERACPRRAPATPPRARRRAAAAPAAGERRRAADAAPPRHPLRQLLAQHAAETDTDGAFATALRPVGREVPAERHRSVHAGRRSRAWSASSERGSFGQLRLYNRPAILLLNDGAGTKPPGGAHPPR